VWNVQQYRYAASATEAVSMMRAGAGKGCYVAGGTDLMLFPPDVDFVVDVNNAGIDEVVCVDGGDLYLGAATPLQVIAESPLVAGFAAGAIAEAAAVCGNRPVRSVATVGGNLCSAIPSADMAPVLLALDAQAVIADEHDQQTVPLRDFFTGPRRTVLGDRLLVGISVPASAAGRAVQRFKLTRSAEDIALVQVVVALGFDGTAVHEARVSLGAVAPTPLLVDVAAEALVGCDPANWTPEAVESAVTTAAAAAARAAQPIDDHRASAAYRRAMVEVLVKRLARALLPAQDGAA